MATASEIMVVRENTDEATEETFDDTVVGDLIDENGVNGASAVIWRRKAARFAGLVDVSEAGASHKFGDLQKNALLMASLFSSAADAEIVPEVVVVGPKVKKIVRD